MENPPSLPGNLNSKTGERYIYPEGELIRVAVPGTPVKRFAGYKMEEAVEWRDAMLKKAGLWKNSKS